MTRSWVSTTLRRAALTVMLVVALLALPFVAGELLDDPGGWSGGLMVLVLAATAVALVAEALRRPDRALRLVRVGLAGAAVYAVLEGVVPALRAGPVVGVAALVLALPASVAGLRRPREAGVLVLCGAGVTMLDRVVVLVAERGSTVLHVGGSAAAIALPLLVVGTLFLLAWLAAVPSAASRRAGLPAPPPTTGRHRAPTGG